MGKEKEVMSATQAIEYLKISRTTLHRFVKRGLLHPINEPNPLLDRPKTLLFARSEIEQLKQNPPA
jgi:predicted site-specific integrase-resolvase